MALEINYLTIDEAAAQSGLTREQLTEMTSEAVADYAAAFPGKIPVINETYQVSPEQLHQVMLFYLFQVREEKANLENRIASLERQIQGHRLP